MNEKEFDYINMIPFIDVMLVLLTIVLTTSTFAVTGIIPVELPKVAGKHEAATVTQVVVIDKQGAILYQGKAITLPDLKARITAIPRQTPFVIKADKDIPLQGFVEVLDLIKTVGFRKVSLQTEWTGQ
ncbi:MAG: biopolymer transporter ExbD [Proteobacteria bacterium]|nr:biopolymer transporter ExbD [Pseudomonadota bacterium]MBU2226918.1 biopolymer transporter ExbD [Pseudomonadota bacterium]MBU2260472.1 biopolymer transporter ExbD [Pseudomonadota bacterium]